jgi:hypothetical protein
MTSPKQLGGFVTQAGKAASMIKGPLSAAAFIMALAFGASVWLVSRGELNSQILGVIIVLAGAGMAFAIVMTSMRNAAEKESLTPEMLVGAADDLANRIYVPVTAYFRNFPSASERIEGYRTLAESMRYGKEDSLSLLRIRISERIRENVKVAEKVDIFEDN